MWPHGRRSVWPLSPHACLQTPTLGLLAQLCSPPRCCFAVPGAILHAMGLPGPGVCCPRRARVTSLPVPHDGFLSLCFQVGTLLLPKNSRRLPRPLLCPCLAPRPGGSPWKGGLSAWLGPGCAQLSQAPPGPAQRGPLPSPPLPLPSSLHDLLWPNASRPARVVMSVTCWEQPSDPPSCIRRAGSVSTR